MELITILISEPDVREWQYMILKKALTARSII